MNSLKQLYFLRVRAGAFLLILLAGFTGCDNKSNNNVVTPTQTAREHFKAVTLTGLVNNDITPIHNGRVEATDKNGKLVASFELKDNNKFKIKIPETAAYPIVLTAFPEAAKSKDEHLRVAIANPAPKYFDITSLTTVIAKKAMAMGGYTNNNLM